MTNRAFSVREYVWDVVRDGPAWVIEVDRIDDAAICPYTVVEIIHGDGHSKLGRVARRSEEQLERYVKLLVPEREAIAHALRDRAASGLNRDHAGLRKRFIVALEKRGIAWSQ